MSHVLTYDTLPAHSRLRREFIDGVLRITAAPEEPGPLVKRTALVRSAIPAGILFSVALIIFLAVFGMMYQANRRGMSTGLVAALVIAFVIFCVAVFAFIWRAQYSLRLDAAQNALRQTTILAASTGRLLVETTGPLGEASYDLKGDATATIVQFAIGRCDARGLVDCLEIQMSDGSRIHLLPGRDERELRWVARALAAAVGI